MVTLATLYAGNAIEHEQSRGLLKLECVLGLGVFGIRGI